LTSAPRSDQVPVPPHGLEYFYTPPELVNPPVLLIEAEEFRHLSHVMRRREGDIIGVVDGAGVAYVARLEKIQKHSARCTILSTFPGLHEPSRNLTVAMGVLKNPSRTDTLVEKLTELGVRSLIPMLTTRTIPRHARVERWEKIALAAMKQSGRCVLPALEPLTHFQDVLSRPAAGPRLILHEEITDIQLEEAVSRHDVDVLVCVGSEGGFTDEEIAAAVAGGFVPAGLGSRRLRSETAAIAAAARLLS